MELKMSAISIAKKMALIEEAEKFDECFAITAQSFRADRYIDRIDKENRDEDDSSEGSDGSDGIDEADFFEEEINELYKILIRMKSLDPWIQHNIDVEKQKMKKIENNSNQSHKQKNMKMN